MASKKQHMEHEENIRAILRCIRANKGIGRQLLADKLGLSWGCISEAVTELIENGLLSEEKMNAPSVKGRTPSGLYLNPQIGFLGVDINRMGLKACLCDFSGVKTASFCREILSADAVAPAVVSFVRDILRDHKEVRGVGFAMQGVYDSNHGLWHFPGERPLTIDFEREIAHMIALPCMVGHDPDCMLYPFVDEHTVTGKMLVRVDRGIGAAIYKDGHAYRDGLMEIGYMRLGPAEETLQDLVCIPAVEKAAGHILNGSLDDATVAALCRAGHYLGIALGNISCTLSLDEIILCGELMKYEDVLMPELMAAYRRTALPTSEARIVTSDITSAAYGAAKKVLDSYIGECKQKEDGMV